MKKRMLWKIFGCLLILLPLSISANEPTSSTEVIVEEEETPQAGGKRYQQSMMLTMVAMASLVGVAAYVVTSNQHHKSKPHLAVTNVTDNGDGSFVVNIGFNEPLKETTTFNNANINVSKGCAIILKKINKRELSPSESKDVFVTVVNKDTHLQCQLDNEVIDIDGMEIMKGIQHE